MRATSVAHPGTTTSALTHLNSYQGKRIIMTGGTGSIGSKVFETLQSVKDIRIVVFSRKPQNLNYHPNVSIMPLNLKDPQ